MKWTRGKASHSYWYILQTRVITENLLVDTVVQLFLSIFLGAKTYLAEVCIVSSSLCDLGMKNQTWVSSVLFQPRKPIVSWATSKAGCPAGQGRWFSSSTSVCIQVWGPQHKNGMNLLGWVQRRTTKMVRMLEDLSLRKGRGSWGGSAWRREGFEETLLLLSLQGAGGLWKTGRLYTRASNEQGAMI